MIPCVVGNLVVHLQEVVEFRLGIEIHASLAAKVVHRLGVVHGLQEVDRIQKQAVDVFSCTCVLRLRVNYYVESSKIAVRISLTDAFQVPSKSTITNKLSRR